MEFKDTLEYKQYGARQKMAKVKSKRATGLVKKLSPEEIVEAICRLDSVDLVRIGDVAQEKAMADKLIRVLEAAIMESSIPRKFR
jgi:hypothetical protein